MVLTALSTTSVITVYDFNDTVITGTYSLVSNVCTVNATAHGLITGQKVRLSFTSGTAPSGVYLITLINDNSYSVAVTTANTSGNISTYPNSMRVYAYNVAGIRQSLVVSWAVKGY